MRARILFQTLILTAMLGLLVAAPASAATTGTLCGSVTAFTAPTAVADGSITINGTSEVIDSSATAALDAATLVIVSAVATAGATTCLEIQADGSGNIIDIAIAAQAEICGAVSFNATLDTYAVGGVLVPASVVSADADLAALLAAAAAGGASGCVDVTVSSTTGLITTVALNATLNLCGTATLDADSVTIGGVDVPLTLLDAEAEAALRVAIDAGVGACLSVVVNDTDLVQANLDVDVDVCGTVTLDASGNAVVDGVTISTSLTNASAEALLALAASADGEACVSVGATSSGGDTTVTVAVTVDVCATVTAITDNTITLGGVVFTFAGASTSGLQVGDVACIQATTPPAGSVGAGDPPIVTDANTTDGVPGGSPPPLSNTAVASPGLDVTFLGTLLVAAAAAGALVRRRGIALR